MLPNYLAAALLYARRPRERAASPANSGAARQDLERQSSAQPRAQRKI